MRYLYATPDHSGRRVMHIARYTKSGEMLMEPLCGRVHLRWNRTINAPFGLGRRVCCWCRAAVPR